MFIYYGTKIIRTRVGFVADFCGMCRAPRACRLIRLGKATHLYGIPFGKGELSGYECLCMTCEIAFVTERERYVDVVQNYPFPDIPDMAQLPQLIKATLPDLRYRYENRIEIEEQLRRGHAQLSPQARMALLREPFYTLAPQVERTFQQTQIDGALLLTIVLALAFAFVSAALAERYMVGDLQALVPVVLAGALFVAFVAIFVQGSRTKVRYMRRKIYPRIGEVLRRLRPQPAELEAVLAELRGKGFLLGKRTKASTLASYLQ